MGLLFEVLRTVDFLADGPPELAVEFMSLGRLRSAQRYYVFWSAGQSAQGIVIPITGELAAINTDPGGRQLCYLFFGPGECAGVPCVLDDLPQASDVRTVRGGEFFVVGRAPFLRFLDGRPTVRSSALATVGRLFRRSLEERDRVVFLSVNARLARFLLERACVRQADGARLLVPETHREIAIRLGSVREVIARAMSDFAERGLIRRVRRTLFAADWEGLRAEAGCSPGDGSNCSCDADRSALRTTRFALPVLERGASRVAEEAAVCGTHLDDPTPCLVGRCALAEAAGLARGGSSVRAASMRTSSSARTPMSVGLLARQRSAAVRRAVGLAGPGRRRVERGPAEDRVELAARVPDADEDFERSPGDRQIIDRRIQLYRRRLAAIESSSGADGHVPASASLFREPLPSEP
jgi:CRP/FNR family transcriptional regulator